MEVKSAFHMLHKRKSVANETDRSNSMMIRRWSVCGGQTLVLHEITGSMWLLFHQMWSGQVQLPSAVSYVGVPRGSAKFMLDHWMRSMSGLMGCGGLKSLWFFSSQSR